MLCGLAHLRNVLNNMLKLVKRMAKNILIQVFKIAQVRIFKFLYTIILHNIQHTLFYERKTCTDNLFTIKTR